MSIVTGSDWSDTDHIWVNQTRFFKSRVYRKRSEQHYSVTDGGVSFQVIYKDLPSRYTAVGEESEWPVVPLKPLEVQPVIPVAGAVLHV